MTHEQQLHLLKSTQSAQDGFRFEKGEKVLDNAGCALCLTVDEAQIFLQISGDLPLHKQLGKTDDPR